MKLVSTSLPDLFFPETQENKIFAEFFDFDLQIVNQL